jgi:hypothetical protein
MSQPRWLPLTGSVPSPWLWGTLGGLGLGIPLVALVLAFPHVEVALLTLWYSGIYLLTPGAFTAWPWARERFRRARRAAAARALGLGFRPRVCWADLEPFDRLPLFRFSQDGDYKAAYWMHGTFEGVPLRVFDLAFTAPFPHRVSVTTLRRSLQTVAVVWAGRDFPPFHLAPVDNDWDELDPEWPEALALGDEALEVDAYSRTPGLVRSREVEAARRLFSEARLRELGPLGGWTVESRGGWLLIYRHREVQSVEELPHFVSKVADLARVFTGPEAEAGPAPEDSASPEGICQAPRKP